MSYVVCSNIVQYEILVLKFNDLNILDCVYIDSRGLFERFKLSQSSDLGPSTTSCDI